MRKPPKQQKPCNSPRVLCHYLSSMHGAWLGALQHPVSLQWFLHVSPIHLGCRFEWYFEDAVRWKYNAKLARFFAPFFTCPLTVVCRTSTSGPSSLCAWSATAKSESFAQRGKTSKRATRHWYMCSIFCRHINNSSPSCSTDHTSELSPQPNPPRTSLVSSVVTSTTHRHRVPLITRANSAPNLIPPEPP